MTTFKVLSNLRHDGEDYSVGDTLQHITDEEATLLVADRIIEPIAQAQIQPPAPAPQVQPAPVLTPAPVQQSTPAPQAGL